MNEIYSKVIKKEWRQMSDAQKEAHNYFIHGTNDTYAIVLRHHWFLQSRHHAKRHNIYRNSQCCCVFRAWRR